MTERYRSYSEAADSGVRWLGAIPAHWEVIQSRRLFEQRKERMRPGDEQLTASQKYGVIPQSEFMQLEDQKVMQVFTGADILKHVEPNDFVISMRSFQGGLEWCGHSGCVSSAYVGITPAKHVQAGFFKYLFKSSPYIQALQSTSNLVRDGQALRFQNFAQVPLPLIPASEQTQIAKFLDYETAKIDALIEKQQQLIALLKEKRQAVISHAVTKGLNPDAPMRDSGVEWLGEVPAHWEVMAIKRLVSVPVTDGPHETPRFIDDGVPFLSAEGVSSGVVDFSRVRGFISEALDAEYSKKYTPKKHDIFMVKSGATTGVTAIVETDRHFNIWSPLAVVRCNAHTDPHFTHFFLRSRNFQEAVELSWSFGTQQNIGMRVIENLHVARPPLDEARRIVVHLTNMSGKMDAISKKAEGQVQLLQERRTALISAAVTGKIDVRNWKAPESNPEAEVA